MSDIDTPDEEFRQIVIQGHTDDHGIFRQQATVPADLIFRENEVQKIIFHNVTEIKVARDGNYLIDTLDGGKFEIVFDWKWIMNGET